MTCAIYSGFYDTLIKENMSIGIYILFVIGAHYSTDTHVYFDSIEEEEFQIDLYCWLRCLFKDLVTHVTASLISLHEKYNANRQTYDIALLELEERVSFDDSHFGAVCLPKPSEIYPPDGTYTV